MTSSVTTITSIAVECRRRASTLFDQNVFHAPYEWQPAPLRWEARQSAKRATCTRAQSVTSQATDSEGEVESSIREIPVEPKIDSMKFKIRGKNEHYMVTTAEDILPLSAPVVSETDRPGDIYLHIHDQGRQVWVLEEAALGSQLTRVWATANDLHPHPNLQAYALQIPSNSHPRWVTQQTAQTYKSRGKRISQAPKKVKFVKKRRSDVDSQESEMWE
ncbi:hypothetical protein FRC03_011678 [Tulasnella sp. 419]|nr:hypothetical protein FRC02_001690 [Tulasnella sp. 418]KAG8953756.1 hypothetical protein FRC03_011678 [Tulasnella sp. 419]